MLSFMKPALVFILIFSYTQIFCEETPKIEKADTYHWRCKPYEESFEKHVVKARELVAKKEDPKNKNFIYAVREYKRHLECWDDKAIYLELGDHHTRQGKLYLAKIYYKKSGNQSRVEHVEKIRLRNLDMNDNIFKKRSLLARKQPLRRSRWLKNSSIVLLTVGSIATATGLSLFIHDKVGGTNSKIAQYCLMLVGSTYINTGALLMFLSEYNRNIADAYGQAPELYGETYYTSAREYYQHSGLRDKTKKLSSRKFKAYGTALLLSSLPMLSLAVYGFFESKRDITAGDDCDGPGCIVEAFALFFGHIVQLATLVPGIASMIGGTILLVKGAKYSKLEPQETVFTLKSISPMINPITKTYGISMGFSF